MDTQIQEVKERNALLLREDLASLVDRFDSGGLYIDAFLEAIRELGSEADALLRTTSSEETSEASSDGSSSTTGPKLPDPAPPPPPPRAPAMTDDAQQQQALRILGRMLAAEVGDWPTPAMLQHLQAEGVSEAEAEGMRAMLVALGHAADAGQFA